MNEDLLAKMFAIIRQNPGIRPSELNGRLGKQHTAYYRQKLIDRGLVVKKRDGAAIRYFPRQEG